MSSHARHPRHRLRRRSTHRLLAGAAAAGLVSTSLAGHAYASTDTPARSPAALAPLAGPDSTMPPLSGDARPILSAAAPEPAAALVPPAPQPVAAPAPPPPPAVVAPVAGGYRITATFGSTGRHWSSGRHTGLDFAGATGTPIAAAAAGTIVEAGRSGAYGNRIVIQHEDGSVTTYNHLSRITAAAGRVEAGAVIGLLGSTGNTTGPHLHFEAEVGGSLVDPRTWLAERGVSV